MMTKSNAALVLTLLLLPLAAQAKPAHTKPVHPKTSLTGTYHRGVDGTIRVKALPGNKVQFQLVALAHLSSPGGPHIGVADDTLTLHHGRAVYYHEKPLTGHLLMTFTPTKVTITQKGSDFDMGFGFSVYATGVYKKISSKPPKFDPTP